MAQPLAQTTPDIVLKSIFKYYDKDGSGKLGKDEFRAYLKSLGLANNDLEAQALKALIDDNNDGKVDFEEFRNFIKTDNAQKIVNDANEFQFLCTVCDIFKQYDQNGDGSISWDEWKQEMAKNGKDEQEAKQLFQANDKNNDKKITFDEFYHSLLATLNSLTMFAITDAWFIISEYMTYRDIGALSIVNKEANVLINQSPVWEQQCRRFFNTEINDDNTGYNANNKYKNHFKGFIELYGHWSITYYQRVILCWNALNKWSKINLPEMLTTFNKPATNKEINEFKKIICNDSMLTRNNYEHLTSYLIFLGECCNGQNRKLSRMGMYGYYTFYNKSSSGHLLSISDSIKYTKQVYNVYGDDDNDQETKLNDLWLYYAGIPTQDGLITIPCLTFMNKLNGKIYKITQDAKPINLKHCDTNSFLQHLEFYIFKNLLKNNYRIHKDHGILRFPLCDIATSECITKGILCRASPLFVPEISNLKHKNYIFAYHIEIECPTTYHDDDDDDDNNLMKLRCKQCPNKPYQLTVRKWFIKDNDKIETVQGPGVIGLYPKVFINQDLFQYQSCSQQNIPINGEMYGYFLFKSCHNNNNHNNDSFELELKPYKLDWNVSQWI